MSKRTQRKRSTRKTTRHDASGPPPEAFLGLDDWAIDVAGCLSRDELAALIETYRKIAGNRRVSAANRRLARRQAQSLQKCLKQHS